MLGVSLLSVFVGGTLLGFPLLASKLQLLRLGLIFQLYYLLLVPQVIRKFENSMRSIYRVFWLFLGLFLWVYIPEWAVEMYTLLVEVAWPLYFVLEAFYFVLLVNLVSDWLVERLQLREQAESRGEVVGVPESMLLSLSVLCYAIFSAFLVKSWSSALSAATYFSFPVLAVACAIASTLTVLLLDSCTIVESSLLVLALGYIMWSGTAAAKSFQLKSFIELDLSAVWGPIAQLTVVMFVLLTLPLVMAWARARFSEEKTEIQDGDEVVPEEKTSRNSRKQPVSEGKIEPRVNQESVVWSIMTMLAVSVISKLGISDLTRTSSFRIIELLITTGLFILNAILDN